jgi:hypothetical protein
VETSFAGGVGVGLLVSFFWLVLHSQSLGGNPSIEEGRMVGGDLGSTTGVGIADTAVAVARM